ncbi:hypothetical protein KJ910_01270 [Patescibacteria group bacterium]|nr:hypothetical protein [Patescibacteria group bacterium]MBU1907349.1 hypothetical protein [Patescibacteria group bacterium]
MGDSIDNLIKVWEQFVKDQADFQLNPDREKVAMLARGVLDNEANHGLKYCPCRMTTGERQEDNKLVCPCNFKNQKLWKDNGECWCSLFIKK